MIEWNDVSDFYNDMEHGFLGGVWVFTVCFNSGKGWELSSRLPALLNDSERRFKTKEDAKVEVEAVVKKWLEKVETSV